MNTAFYTLSIITLLILFNLKWKYWKKDNRGYHILLLSSYYFLGFKEIFPNLYGYVYFPGLFLGCLLPYLISLCFPKERRGRVFNNNALCMNYVVFVYAIERLQINWFS